MEEENIRANSVNPGVPVPQLIQAHVPIRKPRSSVAIFFGVGPFLELPDPRPTGSPLQYRGGGCRSLDSIDPLGRSGLVQERLVPGFGRPGLEPLRLPAPVLDEGEPGLGAPEQPHDVGDCVVVHVGADAACRPQVRDEQRHQLSLAGPPREVDGPPRAFSWWRRQLVSRAPHIRRPKPVRGQAFERGRHGGSLRPPLTPSASWRRLRWRGVVDGRTCALVGGRASVAGNGRKRWQSLALSA